MKPFIPPINKYIYILNNRVYIHIWFIFEKWESEIQT
jgi:hypothetical protein